MIKHNMIYFSIFTIGCILSILALLFDRFNVALTILYITIVILLLLKLTKEYHYYKSYNVPPISAIFVLIPASIAVFGIAIAHRASLWETLDNFLQFFIINISFNIDFIDDEPFIIFLNIFSFIFILPFFIMLLFILKKYYNASYSAIFIYRQKYPRQLLIWFNFSIDMALIIIWITSGFIELSSLLFIVISAFLVFQHFLIQFVMIPIKKIPIKFQRFLQAKKSQKVSSQSSNTRRKFLSRKRNIKPQLLAKLTPKGEQLTIDDFRCIFCYNFPVESNTKVVVCPFCGHAAHSHELEKWLTVSNLCSRCNRPISRKKMIRVSGSNYRKVIQLFKEHQLKTRWS